MVLGGHSVPRHLQVVFFDPVSNTRLVYDMAGEDYFGVLLRTAIGELINKIARKTGKSPVQIMADPELNSKFVIRVEPKGSPR